ncbi:DNA-directed RNA polymerase [Halobacteriales archaeon SW_5_68_122]|nr:MAG: DNA-directed RNA polymerase [Halobacteriales archaeon SW_5_68_122]
MYKRVRLKDTVEVPPRHLADVSPELVKRLLQDKLEGRMDEDVGSVVSVTAVHDIGDGAVLPNRPGVYYEAEFDAVTFDPQMQEVVDGEVVEVRDSNRVLSVGDAVRARIVTKSIDERNPRDSKIGLTAKQPGLGKHGWLEEERQRREAQAGD